MSYSSGLLYLLVFGGVSYCCVEAGLFDSSYQNAASFDRLSTEPWPQRWNTLHLCCVTIPALFCVGGLWKTARQRITVLDFYFLVIFSGLNFMELVGSYLTHSSYFHDTSQADFQRKISRLRAYTDWAALPMLAWIIAWSRHVRKGWYPRRNFIVFGVSLLSFFFTIIHATVYAFLIGVFGTLSSIAIYEFYKVHFFRTGTKFLFWTVLLSNVIFCATKLLGSLVPVGLTLTYVHTIFSVVMTSALSYMFLHVIEEINEHKR